MDLASRILTFSQLGDMLRKLSAKENNIASLVETAKVRNGWFTEENIRYALKHWGKLLTKENLEQWTAPYGLEDSPTPKKVAIVMAGNIPLVGFHDFLSVLISGHHAVIKLSSNDTVLLPFLSEKLIEINPSFKERISFSEEKLPHFDAVIATGSNNTARYFEYYFGKHPNIIRKNRNGVAVLTGTESKEDLHALANDIFRYFGLGCRNVSKIYLPASYDFDPFFNAMFTWKQVIDHHKYMNNYDYNKAVYLMSDIPLLDNEFMLLKEDTDFASPISVVHYEYYDSIETLEQELQNQQQEIQCIVGHLEGHDPIPLGESQLPQLNQYADGIDTLGFLQSLS